MNQRDVKLKLSSQQQQKQDKRERYRAVLCAADGSRTTGSVWADENSKRVYFQFFGSGGVGRARCEKIVPERGLGVYVGKTDDGLEWQVLEDDPFLRQTATDSRNYQSVAPNDLQPGGRLFTWLYTKAITPLATYPATTGLTVNIVAGDYPYLGARKTFAGQSSVDLSASQPSSGNHRYVGLYLDSSNTLQTVNGTVVAVAVTPPEPTWPVGAFRLSVVRIANPQTSIVFAHDDSTTNDILDRRMAWSDAQGGGGWPNTGKLMINGVEYDTLVVAVTVAVAGDTILAGVGTHVISDVSLPAGVNLVGVDKDNTIFSCTAAAIGLRTGGGSYIANLSVILVRNENTIERAVYCLGTFATDEFFNCYIECANANTNSGAYAYALQANATGHSIKAAQCEFKATIGAGGVEAIAFFQNGTASSDVLRNCKLDGGTYDISKVGTTSLILDDCILVNGTILDPNSKVTGWYSNATGSLNFLYSGIYRYDPDGARKKESTIALAQTNGANDDEIHLFPGTYDLGSGLTVSKRLHFVGEGDPRSIIITGSGNFTLEPTIAGCTFRNLTILNTAGGGTDRTIIQSNVNDCVYENCILTKTGAADDSACLLQYGGTGTQVINCELTTSGATKNYSIWNNTATASIEVRGGKLSGTTWDIFGDQAGSTITLNNVVLANGLVSFAGVLNWMPEAKIQDNLLYDSLSTIWTWQEGATFNDKADDSYIGLWNCLNNGQTPDITRSTGGSTDPMDYYLTCTFDSAASQFGIVQFLKAADTRKYRGQTVSLSFEAWGTNVVEVRAAVLSWGSTADALTSDVVGTWSTNNPTLATNWSYANTPGADIVITSVRNRYTVNNITIPTTANNIALFIWTSAEEASTDVLNLTRVKLEAGPVATLFVPRDDRDEELRIKDIFRRLGGDYVYHFFNGSGQAVSGTAGNISISWFPEMWKIPTITITAASNFAIIDDNGSVIALTGNSLVHPSKSTVLMNGAAFTGATTAAGHNIQLTSNNTVSGYLDLDARL